MTMSLILGDNVSSLNSLSTALVADLQSRLHTASVEIGLTVNTQGIDPQHSGSYAYLVPPSDLVIENV